MAGEKGQTQKPAVQMTFKVNDAPSKNYIVAPPTQEIGRSQLVPFLMGRDGKLYVDKTLVPENAKGFNVVITPTF